MINGIREDKAVERNMQTIVFRLGGHWCHNILYEIIRKIWEERERDSVELLNESRVIMIYKKGDKKRTKQL